MKIVPLNQRSDEWLAYRKGKITGTKLKNVISERGKVKIGYYQLLADRLAIEPDGEEAMERGARLEEEAIALFKEKYDTEVETDIGVCVSDINERIIMSPDGLIKEGKDYTSGVEIKCLMDARHLEAVLSDEAPRDYYYQVLQYFIVIETLQKMYLVFYHDRIPSLNFKVFEYSREDIQTDIDKYLEQQQIMLESIDRIVEKVAF